MRLADEMCGLQAVEHVHLMKWLVSIYGPNDVTISVKAEKKKRRRDEDYKIADVMSKEVSLTLVCLQL